MKRIGIIGLGKMGRPMAHNLLRSGFTLCVYDVLDAPMQELSTAGATPATSPRAVAENSDVLLLSLPNVPALQNVFRGADGILGLGVDLYDIIIIDTTTATMQIAVELADEVAQRGGWMLDSPVTGGVWGAQNTALRFFVGGEKSAFEKVHDVYEALGKCAAYVGPSGHGQMGKMVCQMIGSVEYAVAAEAMGFAEGLGVDTRPIAQALGERHILQRMLDLRDRGQYGNEGYTAQRGKDIDYAVEEADRHSSYIPVTKSVKEVFDAARKKGLCDFDPLALFLLWQTDNKQSDTAKDS